jgi:Alpha-N-acetylglucosamine transferase
LTTIVKMMGALCLLLLWTYNIYAIRILQQHTSSSSSEKLQKQGVSARRIHNDSNRNDAMMPMEDKKKVQPVLTQTMNGTKTRRSYAYAFVIGGIHEDRPAYKGFLWTILISVHILQKLGTVADFCVFVRLSPDSNMTDLPREERRVLTEMRIKIILQPKPRAESFAQLVYDKFLTLNMTDYKRVMFLDADMIPMTNLDYYFFLSDPEYEKLPTELKPNFIMATQGEPCNTGMFIVEPSRVAFEQYKSVVKRQHEKARTLPYPYFDFMEGWGHNFRKHGDYWESLHRKSSTWKFHASHSDQGLMFYFAKYIRHNVSIAIGEKIQNWKTGNDSLPEMESEKKGVLAMYQGEILRYQWSCDKPKEEARIFEVQHFWWRCMPPYDSTAHFMGFDKKPWRHSYVASEYTTYSFRQTGARYLWFKELTEVNEKYKMGLDMDHWDEKYLPWMRDGLLGKMALLNDQRDVIMSEV